MIMEVKVFVSLDDMLKNKPRLCLRVASPDVFDYNQTVSVLKCLYGNSVHIVVIS